MLQPLTYPIKFTPILKEKIWGGKKLHTVLNKKNELGNIGESWEISDVKDNTSIVSNGFLEGKTLKDLLAIYKGNLIGEKNYATFGNTFPLLIKFIDAKADLSIQVHPNEALAAARHNSFGKTEMWYVLQADKDAELIVGLQKNTTAKKYLKHLKAKTLTSILNINAVKEKDAYFIDVGCVHAIGAGVLLAEIQQTSDITYRIYDWDRVDKNGKKRELHTNLAIDAINFNLENTAKISYNEIPNATNKMVACPYFTTNYIEVTKKLEKENTFDSFVIYMCVAGTITIETKTSKTELNMGETVLLPAAVKQYQINSANAGLLEIYV